jgi:transketolase
MAGNITPVVISENKSLGGFIPKMTSTIPFRELPGDTLNLLASKAKAVRRNAIEGIGAAKSGHPGASLSCADILVTLYFHVMRVDPSRPKWEDRDRFVLSKGHAAPGLYATLAERGFFSPELIKSLRQYGSILQGHPDSKKTPGVDMCTGSLGQGLSISNGMALAAKLDKKDYRVYTILGDGECQEGQIWEAAMTSVHYKLDNLTAFLDYNHLQIDGRIEEVKSLTGIPARFAAWNWNVIEIDGHDYNQIAGAIEAAKAAVGVPTIIVAHTVKGKGVSFMEDQVGWHGTAPNAEQVKSALAELG